MSDDSNLPAETNPNEIPLPDEVALARELVEIEKSKISVELKAIEASDGQDQRMAAFHTRRISLQDEADQRRVKLVRQTMLAIFVFLALLTALVFYMAFWGDESQREIAITILARVGVGIGGFGIIYGGIKGVQSILRRH